MRKELSGEKTHSPDINRMERQTGTHTHTQRDTGRGTDTHIVNRQTNAYRQTYKGIHRLLETNTQTLID